MKRADLPRTTDEQLVARFVEIALAQDDALLYDEIAKFNRLYSQKKAVEDELKRRPDDRRRLLRRLYTHENAQVRHNAAVATLAVFPKEARQALQRIIDAKEFPQAGDAGGLLRGLNDGSWTPT
jgi:hypothetical protein